MSPSRARRKRISDDDWDAHKGAIRRMYLDNNLPLKKVRDELEKAGFSVSEDQLEYRCKTKWGFDKNISAADWKAASQSTTLPLRPQSLQIFHNGQQLQANRVKKGINRKRPPKLGRPKRSAGNKIMTLVVPQVARGISTAPVVAGTADLPKLVLGPNLSVPNQSVWRASSHANIGAEDINVVVRLLSNGFGIKFQSSTSDEGISLSLRWLHDLSRILGAGSIDAPSNKVTVAFTVAAEAAVNAFITFTNKVSLAHLFTDAHAELAYKIVRSLFGLSRRMHRTDLELELLKVACKFGHLEACRFLLDRLEPERAGAEASRSPAAGAEASAIWTFRRLVQWRGPGRLQFLQRLVGILPMKLVGTLLRSIATWGAAGDLKECLVLLVDTLPIHNILVYKSLLACCAGLKLQDMALERTRIVLEEYRRRGALSIARSLGMVSLIEAAFQAHSDVFEYVRSFLNFEVDLSEQNEEGSSVFEAAATSGNLDFFKHILKLFHPPPEQVMSLCLTAFYIAFSKKKFEVCNILKRQMYDITSANIDWRAHLCSCSAKSIQDEDGVVDPHWTVGDSASNRIKCLLCSSAWRACLNSDPELLAFCLEHDLNYKQTKEDAEPVHCSGRNAIQLLDAVIHNNCCYYGAPKYGPLAQVSCAKLLLSQGLCLLGGETIAALRSGNLALARLIMRADKTNVGCVSAHETSLVEAAILGGDRACIESMWQHSGRVYDARALCAACSILSENPNLARFNIAQILSLRPLGKPADILEMTAVGLAALKKDIGVLRGLLKTIGKLSGLCFAPLELQESHLRPSSQPGCFLPISFFSSGTRSDQKLTSQFWVGSAKRRCPLLAMGIFSKDIAVISALLDAGLKPDGLSISLATLSGHQEILSLLLREPPNLSKWTLLPGAAARPPLVYATMNRDLKVLAQLLSAGADINDGGKHLKQDRTTTYTPLQAAAAAGSTEMVAFLLQKGARVNAEAGDYRGATALQYAATYGHSDVARMLLEHGANINDPPASFDGRTCIEGAAEGGFLEMIDLLIENNVAVNWPHRVQYILAVVRAEICDHRSIAHHLQAFGGWDAADEETSRIAQVQLIHRHRISRSGWEEAHQDVGWNPKDDINNVQGRLLLQARWEAIRERQHIQGTKFGTWESEPTAAMREPSPSGVETFHSVSMATPPMLADHISWNPSPPLSPWRPAEFRGSPGLFDFIDLDFGSNAAAPAGWGEFSPLLVEPGRVLGPAEDDGAEGSHGDLALLDAPMGSLDFSWGADLS